MKFIDPDGRQVGYPPFSNIDPTQVRNAYLNQKYPHGSSMGKKMSDQLYKAAPDAIVVSGSGRVGVGAYIEGKVSIGIMLKGEDKGTTNFYATGSYGVEFDAELSGSASVDAVKPELTNKLEAIDLEGSSQEKNLEVSITKYVSVNASKSDFNSEKAGKVESYGIGVNYGASLKSLVKNTIGKALDMLNIGTQTNETKGFKTNTYKDEKDKR